MPSRHCLNWANCPVYMSCLSSFSFLRSYALLTPAHLPDAAADQSMMYGVLLLLQQGNRRLSSLASAVVVCSRWAAIARSSGPSARSGGRRERGSICGPRTSTVRARCAVLGLANFWAAPGLLHIYAFVGGMVGAATPLVPNLVGTPQAPAFCCGPG